MDKKEMIKSLLKENKIDSLNEFNKNSMANILLEILEEELEKFSYDKDINYLKRLIKILPKYQSINQKKYYEKIKIIHQKIKTYLVQKPGYIEKNNPNYKVLKNIINNIELIEISFLYDYIEKYEESKYELIDYIIFDVKNITFLKHAINRFPYIANFFDENDKSLITNVIEKYIEEVMNYSKSKEIDLIIYYDEVIDILISSPKLIFDIIDKQNILKLVKQKLMEIKEDKDRKTFYLNSLIEKINTNESVIDISYLKYKYHIKTYFNEAIKLEEKSIMTNYHLSKKRTLINDYILTFDGENAKEIDDALSIKMLDNGNYLLGVHIADPTSIINEQNILFDEAARRTTSIYLSDQTYYLFPESISCDLLSLKENNYRNAKSYYFEINRLGNVIDYKFLKSIIKVNKNMTYSDFNRILLNKTDNILLNNTIDNLSKVSNLLEKYYNADELYNKINRSNNNITNTNIVGVSNGEKVVENTMIFTNFMVASYFKDKQLPFIYRNHVIDSDMMIKLDKLKHNIYLEKDGIEYSKYIDIVKNIYPKANYELECKGHFGLGIDCYAHVTSPLRRFADVIASICINELYFNEYDSKKLENIKNMILKYTDTINNKRNLVEKFVINYEYIKSKKMTI